MFVLENISTSQIKRFYMLVTKYLCGIEKPHVISIKVLSTNKESGGLRFVNLKLKEQALKIKWVNTYRNNLFFNVIATNELNSPLGLFTWQCNLNPKDVSSIFEQYFWREVLEVWCKSIILVFLKHMNKLSTKSFGVTHIKIAGKIFVYQEMMSIGINRISDLISPKGTLYIYSELKEVYMINRVTWLEYYSLVSAIPTKWLDIIDINTGSSNEYTSRIEKLRDQPGWSKSTYSQFIVDKDITKVCCLRGATKFKTHIDFDHFKKMFI